MREKGKMTVTIIDCLPLGPPRIGKTCVKDRLAGRKPTGNPAMVKDGRVVYPEEVSLSTGAADSVLKMVVETTFQEQGKQWVPRTLDQEIMSFVKRMDDFDQVQTSELSSILDTKTLDMLSKQPDIQLHAGNIQSAVVSSSQEIQQSPSRADPSSQLFPVAPVVSHDSLQTRLAPPEFISEALLHKDFSQVPALTDGSFVIHFTDTGGQSEFHEVLPALVSGPSMFFLCFSLPAGLSQPYKIWYKCYNDISTVYESSYTVKDVLLQCLNSVYCIGTQRRIEGKMEQVKPKVFFIGTQKDLVSEEKVKVIDLELQQAIQDRKELCSLVEYYTTNPLQLIFTVNNYDKEDHKFQEIREAVHAVAERENEMYRVNLPIPIATLDLWLRQLTQENTLSTQQVLSIAEKHGVSTTMLEQHIGTTDSCSAFYLPV